MAANFHATAIVIGDRGVLIRGASGTGKTTLALALISALDAAGRRTVLVADDQVLLSVAGGRLVCAAPAAITGLVEVRGRAPQPVASEPRALIDLVVTLVDAPDAPRFAEDETCEIAGCTLPDLTLEARNIAGALPAIAAWLKLPPFV